jgi:hypothetical protein
VASLSKKDKHLPSCCPPSIPILHSLSPINNSYYYYVIRYIMFPSGIVFSYVVFCVSWL